MRKKFLALFMVAVFCIGGILAHTSTSYAATKHYGWVASKYLEQTSRPDRSGTYYAKVKLDSSESWCYLNVRRGPSIHSRVIDTLHHGHSVFVDLGNAKHANGVFWVEITYYK